MDGGGPGAPCLLLQEPLLSCVPHCYAQEVSRLCHLSAGTYRIVPSTYLPDTEGAFTVTIATRIDRWGPGRGRPQGLGVPLPVPLPGRGSSGRGAPGRAASWPPLPPREPPLPCPTVSSRVLCPAGAPSTAGRGWGSCCRR